MKVLKVFLFLVFFYIFSLVLAFFLLDDEDAYTRLVMHDFQNQDNIDILFCGASHVSHGVLSEMLDDLIGKSTCSAGTPNQEITGSYAIINAAAEMYDIEEIFFDIDFGVATGIQDFSKTRYTTSEFLVAHYLKNLKVKLDFTLYSTSPKYYLNAIFPLGVEKALNLNPFKVYKNLKKKLTGEYYKYEIDDDERQYHKKGCIFEFEPIKNGTLATRKYPPINIKRISPGYKEYILKMMDLCKQKNIRLTFCIYPMSDFYLIAKRNYEDFTTEIKKFLSEQGYELYDFNLMKETFLTLEDEDFNDDEHLNDRGIKKFTVAMAEFLKAKDSREELFYATYTEKLKNQPHRILGIMLEDTADRTALNFFPVLNTENSENVSWKICVESGGVETVYIERTRETTIEYPKNMTGNLKIYGYYGEEQQTCGTKFFNTK